MCQALVQVPGIQWYMRQSPYLHGVYFICGGGVGGRETIDKHMYIADLENTGCDTVLNRVARDSLSGKVTYVKRPEATERVNSVFI